MAVRTLYEIKNGTAQTTDGTTQTPVATYDISTGAPGGTALNNCTVLISARIAGYDTTNNVAAGELIAGCFKVVSGTLSQVGTTSTIINMLDDMTSNPNTGFSVSGTVITHWVTGVNAKTVQWYGRIEITVYQPV